jgi:hypothetical protein
LAGSLGIALNTLGSAGAGPASERPRGPGNLEKLRDLEVYRSPRHYCGPGPGIVRLSDGELLVAFRRSPFDQYAHGHPDVEACLVRSRDGGTTWSEPHVFDSGPITNQNLTLLADGTVLCASHGMQLVTERTYRAVVDRGGEPAANAYELDFRPQTPGGTASKPTSTGYYAVEQGTYVRRSADRGRTWSQRYWVDIPGFSPVLPGFPPPLYIRGPVRQLRNGTLVLAVYTNERRTGIRSSRSLLVLSHDGGRTWTKAGTIAVPESPVSFDETEVYECPSGKLVAFLRIGYPDRAQMKLHTAVSRDGGQTWSKAERREVWGHPFDPIPMSSGRVLLTYGYRREPYGIRARLLDPECEEIEGAREFVLRDDGAHGDLGYPSATPLPGGQALVTYYMNTRADSGTARFIAATVVRETE